MKKILLIVMMIMVSFTLTGCGSDNVEGKLEDLMADVYADIPDDEKPMMLMNTEVNEENIEFYLGTDDIDYESALASESGVGSIAHSVVLVRVKDGENVEEVKEEIKENVDPRKWICVGVEEEDVIVKSRGNLVVLIMVEDETTREKLEEAFDNL